MCLALYIATDKPLPSIPYDEKNPSLNTNHLSQDELSLKKVFSKSFIMYVGSDEGCSCGFRHALLQQDQWYDVVDDQEELSNHNHIELVSFIRSNASGGNLEILACWDGDHNEAILYRETIEAEDLLSDNFYFKERGLYTVNV
jgi:hypothetical protein